MTVRYVDSGASGANDGTSPTDAWTDIASAVSAAVAGDIVYLSHTHSQTPNATLSMAWADDVKVVSSDFGNIVGGFPVRRTGATFAPTGGGSDIGNSGGFYFYGTKLDSPDKIFLNPGNNNIATYDTCELEVSDDGSWISGDHATLNLINTTFNQTVNDFMSMGRGATLNFLGGSYTRAAGAIGCIQNLSTDIGNVINFIGTDLTGIPSATPIIEASASPLIMFFDKCKMNSTFDLGTIIEGSVYELLNSEDGTLTEAAFTYQRFDFYGQSETVLTHYREGGSDDGEQANPYSQKVTALAGNTIKGLRATKVPLSTYIDNEDNGTKTVKIHFAHNGIGSGTAGAVQDNEVWFVGISTSDAGTPIALGVVIDTLADDGQAADLPLETGETWVGSAVGTKQSVSFDIIPTINGLIHGELHFATGSGSDQIIYVGLKMEIS